MKTEYNQPDQTRAIPPVPGGGSWTFDYDLWQWASNHPAPAADSAPVHTEPKAEE